MGARAVWAMTAKEFRQLRRDRRTVALLVFQPLIMLIVFGYAVGFDVEEIATSIHGPQAERTADALPPALEVETIDAAGGRDAAEAALRGGDVTVAVVTDGGVDAVLVDGSQLFAARSAVGVLRGAGLPVEPEILYNPDLASPPVLVPGLAGLVMAFVGTIATSLGIVRERQAGTMEQLAVMPFRAVDVLAGKLVPYLLVGLLDLVLVVGAAITVFDVPFNGSWLLFATGAVVFLVVTLGLGLFISTVSENQGQAMQLALMVTLPQVLLSGMIFPLDAMPEVLTWVSYVLPLTWFVQVAVGVMLRAATWADLAVPLLALGVQALVVFVLSVVRVRRDLLPATGRGRAARHDDAPVAVDA
ncbi:MAG TPA: ABC transporter permease [Egicoccus sp.]|nr:ABC transporter permease [Egicoccus sp.]HSK22437.1 ABC transporter permease [Egicoccus sp.]